MDVDIMVVVVEMAKTVEEVTAEAMAVEAMEVVMAEVATVAAMAAVD